MNILHTFKKPHGKHPDGFTLVLVVHYILYQYIKTKLPASGTPGNLDTWMTDTFIAYRPEASMHVIYLPSIEYTSRGTQDAGPDHVFGRPSLGRVKTLKVAQPGIMYFTYPMIQ